MCTLCLRRVRTRAAISACDCFSRGKGENCIDHWMRHCMILHLVLLLLLGTEGVHGIHALANKSQHGLAAATHILFHLRRAILEKGGLQELPVGSRLPNDPAGLRLLNPLHSRHIVINRNASSSGHPVPAPATCTCQSDATPSATLRRTVAPCHWNCG